MPFKPLTDLDPQKLEKASRNLCALFRVPSLRVYQTETGQNVLKGISTFLDIPTGGGKTLAYWYPLFYYWEPGNTDKEFKKTILVVGPLTALMQSQASSLAEKGVPAIAITATSDNPKQLLKEAGENKYRVVLVSPEMATSTKFHEMVLSNKAFADNIICLDIDEGHCISEWGNDDFRPEFSNLRNLLARLPSGVPVVVGSATMPWDVMLDILDKLRLRKDCARVSVSNAKLNVALSVRILQHPQSTFADLITLFPRDAAGPEDFPQTLIYADGRQTVQDIQNFLRRNTPDTIDESAFEFYHRFIAEDRKLSIQERIEDGILRGVPATDALGMGMDFKGIMRVILWLCPKSFLSLVQKIGRCGRLAELLGEAILYITSATYIRYEIDLEILKGDAADDEEDEESAEEQPAPVADGEQMDREAVINANDEEETQLAPKRKPRSAMSVMEARDRRFLLEYMVTKGCRRIPWNKFFGNDSKYALPYPVPPNSRCCDNCSPELFPVETGSITGGSTLRSGRRRYKKASDEVVQAITRMLEVLRENIVRRHWPNQYIITGKIMMSNEVVTTLATRARDITTVEALQQTVRWVWTPRFGVEVVEAIQTCLLDYPDLELQEREERERERNFSAPQALAQKDLRKKLALVFDGCHEEILSQTRPNSSVKVCQIFLTLPRKTRWPDYYELIKEPISIAHIKKYSHTKLVNSTSEYAALWRRLFDNARTYNQDGSQVYQDAEFLQGVLNNKLQELSRLHHVPGPVTVETAAETIDV
ncbi:P-loop containing nucleoside triphosphate hydrolase protein [Mycena latifolia]|nr:P-loop containing nucleoside triphosphate hydrolase protein [Mycena latifolia]